MPGAGAVGPAAGRPRRRRASIRHHPRILQSASCPAESCPVGRLNRPARPRRGRERCLVPSHAASRGRDWRSARPARSGTAPGRAAHPEQARPPGSCVLVLGPELVSLLEQHPVSKHGRGAWPNGRNPSGRYRSNKTGCGVSSKVKGPEAPGQDEDARAGRSQGERRRTRARDRRRRANTGRTHRREAVDTAERVRETDCGTPAQRAKGQGAERDPMLVAAAGAACAGRKCQEAEEDRHRGTQARGERTARRKAASERGRGSRTPGVASSPTQSRRRRRRHAARLAIRRNRATGEAFWGCQDYRGPESPACGRTRWLATEPTEGALHERS